MKTHKIQGEKNEEKLLEKKGYRLLPSSGSQNGKIITRQWKEKKTLWILNFCLCSSLHFLISWRKDGYKILSKVAVLLPRKLIEQKRATQIKPNIQMVQNVLQQKLHKVECFFLKTSFTSATKFRHYWIKDYFNRTPTWVAQEVNREPQINSVGGWHQQTLSEENVPFVVLYTLSRFNGEAADHFMFFIRGRVIVVEINAILRTKCIARVHLAMLDIKGSN